MQDQNNLVVVSGNNNMVSPHQEVGTVADVVMNNLPKRRSGF